MNDVTVMVLTLGESTLNEALASVQKQSTRPAEVLVVENEQPVSRAFHVGSRRVRTPFFMQCDADMILSADCLQVLRDGMEPDVGVCVGFLQDDILGPIQGVKLFRTDAVLPYTSSSLASDSDMIGQMLKGGWKMRFCRREQPHPELDRDVLGLHRPTYDDEEYLFFKFSRQGSKARYRRSMPEFLALLQALKTSTHPKADLALLAFCHGFFAKAEEDLHREPRSCHEYELYRRFRQERSDDQIIFSAIKLPGVDYSTYPTS